MNRLLDIGFEIAGHWQLSGDDLTHELVRYASQHNILYAFASDGEVKYVGKTIQTLRKRMASYKNPGATQSTNIKNHNNIRKLLESGAAIDILALPDNGLMHYGPFHLNLAAGLEDNIIEVMQPEWNGKPKKAQDDKDVDKPKAVHTFPLILQKTYYSTGFFNISVQHAEHFGDDGQQIEIFCGDAAQPVTGVINRRANTNGTPRIMGGVGLRDWFRENASEMQEATISVYSPNSIRIGVASEG